jgi:hypothetical protein
MSDKSYAIKSFDSESRVENIPRSVKLLELAALPAVPGGTDAKKEAKKPLKLRSEAAHMEAAAL